MARVSVLGDRPDSLGPPEMAPGCPRNAVLAAVAAEVSVEVAAEPAKGKASTVTESVPQVPEVRVPEAECRGRMRQTGQTMLVPAWAHDTLALLRCDVCGERAYYRQVVAFEALPGDLEM